MPAPPIVIETTRPRTVVAVRWLVTIAATIVSTWALDAVAAAAGVVLVASNLFADAPRAVVFGLLAVSYLAWAAGLGVNLRANWQLLEATGTSTNALSKLAVDVTRARTANRRTQQVAAAAGYVATELAKEAPYYAGAFGTALLSDAVDTTDALVFLAGANLGAAVYECGVASLTRAVLGGRRCRTAADLPAPTPGPAYATFDDDWVPRHYLDDYYSSVEPDEQATIAFFVDAFRGVEAGRPVLLFGVGPTMHHVFLTAATATEIHLADYLPANLHEIERWLTDERGAHDWRPFVRYTLACEGRATPTDNEVEERQRLTRAKVSALLAGDARHVDPLRGRGSGPYATVVSAYCADSATADPATWETYMRNIAGLVEPGGTFVTAALRRSRGYQVGGKVFPSACIDETDLRRVLEDEFDVAAGRIEVRELADQPWHGYAGIVLAHARRRATGA